MTLPKHIFCQCMKPWRICANKKNSYKIDVRDLIDINSLKPPIYYTKNDIYKNIPYHFLNYDFINKKWLLERFECRFRNK